jgi:hypothetical protein
MIEITLDGFNRNSILLWCSIVLGVGYWVSIYTDYDIFKSAKIDKNTTRTQVIKTMKKVEKAMDAMVANRLRHYIDFDSTFNELSIDDIFDYEKNSRANPDFRLPAIYNTKLFQVVEKLLEHLSIQIYKSIAPFLQCPSNTNNSSNPNNHVILDFYTNTTLIITIDNCFPINGSLATIQLYTKDDKSVSFQFYSDYYGVKSAIPFSWQVPPQWGAREENLLRETVQKTIPYISPQIYLNYLLLQEDSVFNSMLNDMKTAKARNAFLENELAIYREKVESKSECVDICILFVIIYIVFTIFIVY